MSCLSVLPCRACCPSCVLDMLSNLQRVPKGPPNEDPSKSGLGVSFCSVSSLRREFKGQHDRGNRTESLWRGKPASERFLRGSLRGRFAEVFRSFQRFSGGFFRGPLRDRRRGRFPSQRLSVLLPLIVLPFELSPIPFPMKQLFPVSYRCQKHVWGLHSNELLS